MYLQDIYAFLKRELQLWEQVSLENNKEGEL